MSRYTIKPVDFHLAVVVGAAGDFFCNINVQTLPARPATIHGLFGRIKVIKINVKKKTTTCINSQVHSLPILLFVLSVFMFVHPFCTVLLKEQ